VVGMGRPSPKVCVSGLFSETRPAFGFRPNVGCHKQIAYATPSAKAITQSFSVFIDTSSSVRCTAFVICWGCLCPAVPKARTGCGR